MADVSDRERNHTNNVFFRVWCYFLGLEADLGIDQHGIHRIVGNYIVLGLSISGNITTRVQLSFSSDVSSKFQGYCNWRILSYTWNLIIKLSLKNRVKFYPHSEVPRQEGHNSLNRVLVHDSSCDLKLKTSGRPFSNSGVE